MTQADIEIRLTDLEASADQHAVLELLNMYASEPLGGGEPLAPDVRQRLIPDLQRHTNCRVFLAFHGDQPVGLAICFLGYSSFKARRLINIHDLAVTPQMRGRGVGRRMLQAVEAEARRCGCCHITLEVRADNVVARGLYEDFGFEPGDPASNAHLFWKKPLE